MAGPKVVIIGAGSFFFGRPVIWNMAHSEILRDGTLALVDTDAEVLATMTEIAKRVFDHTGVPTNLEASIDRRELLKDADFVIPTFSDRNAHFRGLDCEIALRHGIRMCSGDTIGPGGIFRALREIPTLLAVARDVEELAPGAWIINFVNPSTVLGMALQEYSPVRSFSICDGPHEPHYTLGHLKLVGIVPQDARSVPSDVAARLDLRISGVNHFSWVVRFAYDGKDMMPTLRDKIAELSAWERRDAAQETGAIDTHQDAGAKSRFNSTYSLELFDIYGAFPNCIAHTKEYVPFYQGYGVAPVDPEAIRVFDAEERARTMVEHRRVNAAYASGERAIEEFIKEGRSDHATDIIESMWGGLGKVFRVNTANQGAVPNMPADAYLELASHIDMQRVQPIAVGNLPLGVRGLVQQVLDTHELTAIAAATCDREVLLRACATDPIMNNLGDCRALINDLLEAERDALPGKWFE